MKDRVHFDDTFLLAAALGQLISTADVVLLPYDSLEQVTSGVLMAPLERHALSCLQGGVNVWLSTDGSG